MNSVKEFISDQSYAGGSYDGAYLHAKKDVPQHINEAFHVEDGEVHKVRNVMHRSGLAEKRAIKKSYNEWVNKTGRDIASVFKDHNYEKINEEFKETADPTGIELLDPKFQSETRFVPQYRCHAHS